jgi:hypothetical protein
MKKAYLIETAGLLKKVQESTYDEYYQKADLLASKMNEAMIARADINDLVGLNNIEMMKDNHYNHVRFIASILKHMNADVLVDTVLWVFRAYRRHGFTTNYWAAQINTWIQIFKSELTAESYDEVLPYYEWMQVNIPIFAEISGEELDSSKSMQEP